MTTRGHLACMTFANTCTYKTTNVYVYRSDLVVLLMLVHSRPVFKV